MSYKKIERALLSVSDKTGLVEFATFLSEQGVELISTGGTAKALRDAGLTVTDMSAYTGFPEMLDGRVKTLHPKVHGGLLFIRGNPNHEKAVAAHGIKPIDLVVVNLYPFEKTVAKPGVQLHEAIENIDIGGPSMLRSAAKNHDSVTVVVDPSDYAEVKASIVANTGGTTLELRHKLALKVFQRTGGYDSAIADYLKGTFEVNPLPLSRYPTRVTVLHSQLTGEKYPEEFISTLTGQFPEWSDLQSALEEGDFAVGSLLMEAGEKSLPPTLAEILSMSSEKHMWKLRYRAAMATKALQFHEQWLQIVEPWRANSKNWPPAREIESFFTTDNDGKIRMTAS